MAATAARLLNRLAIGSTVLGVGGFALSNCLYNVDGGHRAVIWDRFNGIQPGVYGEGTHFRIPLLQYPTVFDVRLRPRVISTRTGTKDLQQVQIALRVLAKPEVDALPSIYRQYGEDYQERVLPSIINEVLKATVAQFDAEQLLTQRDRVSRRIRETLEERAKEFNLMLDDVSITHLAFGREFTRAIEHKQVAQQDAERSKFVVMQAEQEKKAAVIQAEGEAEAARLISDSLAKHGDAVIDVKRIEASKEIAATLSQSPNVVYLPGSSGGGAASGGGSGSPSLLLSVGRR